MSLAGPASLSREQLVERFQRTATDAAATVEIVERKSAALESVVQTLATPTSRIAVAAPEFLHAELFMALLQGPGTVVERSRTALSTADIGITEAFAAVASTGSVCVKVESDYTGYVSLLVPLHIAVVDAETIVERPSDLFCEERLGGRGLIDDFVFITGPSATADMGPLVRGVHGPHRLHVVVLT